MQQDHVLSSLAEVLEKLAKVDRSKVTRTTRLRDDLGVDSLAMIDVAVAAEDAFGVRLPDEDVERFETVGDIVDHIRHAKTAA